MLDEFEVVSYPQISNMYAFLVTVDHRTPHLHRELEFDLILEGEVTILCPNEEYTLSRGDMLLLNPNVPHELSTFSKNATILCIQISPKFWRNVFPGFDSIVFDAGKLLEHFPYNQRITVMQQFIELAICYMKKQPYYELQCSGLLNLFVFNCLKNLPSHVISQEEQWANKKRMERLQRILDYADENYTNKLLLSEIAKKENLSLSYLSRFIKDNLNQTFQELVNNLRFNQARKLLLTTSKTVLEISLESGFSDPRYLSKTFLQKVGCSPNEFRKTKHSQIPEAKEYRSIYTSQRYYQADDTIRIIESFRNAL